MGKAVVLFGKLFLLYSVLNALAFAISVCLF